MDYTLEIISGNILGIMPTGTLTTNRQYTVTIKHGISGILWNDDTVTISGNYEFWFTSLYCPIFSTVGRVKIEAGPAAESILDDTIYRMIHKNSLDAVDIYNLNMSVSYAYDYWGCCWIGVPFQIRRYVECKTAYDILALAEQLSGLNAGNQLKTLGDMTISYKGGGNNLVDPNKKKQLYDCWNQLLSSYKNINVAVRGWYDDSKGYSHPVRSQEHNRVIRPQTLNNNNPSGPWENGYEYQSFYND